MACALACQKIEFKESNQYFTIRHLLSTHCLHRLSLGKCSNHSYSILAFAIPGPKRRTRFISFITLTSVLGIALGVTALDHRAFGDERI